MPPERHQYYRWEVLALLSVAFFLDQGDRAIFGIVLAQIRADLALTDAELGLVGSVLFLTLALTIPIAGLAGQFCRKNVVTTSALCFWSAAALLTGLSRGFWSLLLLFSVATGGGEAFFAPAAYAMLADYHERTRALAMSILQGALYAGMITCGVIGGWIAQAWGWRILFISSGAAGLVFGIICMLRLRDAQASTPRSSQPAPEQVTVVRSLGALFAVPTALLLTIGFTASVFVINAYLVWSPEFLRLKGGLSLRLAGSYAMGIHFLPALVGVLYGGYLSDRLAAKQPRRRLQLMMIAMLLAAPAIVLLATAKQMAVSYVGIALFGLFRGLYESNIVAALFDVIAPRFRSAAYSMMIMIGFTIGSTSSWILGQCLTYFGQTGLQLGFASLGIVYVVGAIAIWIAFRVTFARDHPQNPDK
jgi:MFS family permease